MAILINQKNCDNLILNLGEPSCSIDNGRKTGFIYTSPDWSIDISDGTFDLDAVNNLIQDGTFIPVLGAAEIINNTPEATIEESQGGIKSVVRNGLVETSAKIKKTWAYARALYSMNSQSAYNVLEVFEDGSIAGELNGTTFSGFAMGMLNAGTFMHTDGQNDAYVMLQMQYTSVDAYNVRARVIDRSALGFNANKLQPITDIVMVGSADISANKVYFTANFAMNEGDPLGGIDIVNLKCYIDGTPDTITSGSLSRDSLSLKWSFTPTTAVASGQKIVVQLYDSVNSIAVAKIGQRYYKGATAQITPVA